MKAVVLLAAVLCVAGYGSPSAQSAKDLVGTWAPVKNVNTDVDGKTSESFGANPKGISIFTEDARFVTFNIKDNLPRIAASNRNQATAEENKIIAAGSIALYGTYTVSGNKLTLNIDQSTYPNWSGTKQVRDIVLVSPDEVVWKFDASRGGHTEVTYRRLKAPGATPGAANAN